MAAKESTMLALGTTAPDFALRDYDGKLHRLNDLAAATGLLIAFICNHCPFVHHLRSSFAAFAREYQAKGIAVVAITANDVQVYPQDGPDGMREEARLAGYTFPYLFDETQQVAKAYQAACTPEFYLFDAQRRLVYRGQYDRSRPSNAVPVTGADLRVACDALLAGKPIAAAQVPSMGCSIKWQQGKAPAYA